MSRRSARKSPPREKEDPPPVYMVGPVTFMDLPTEPLIRLPADINETADGLIIRMELPGVPAGDIQIVVRDAVIEVSGEKKPDAGVMDASFLCLERSFGKFRHVFELSGCLDMARVTAALRGGVLSLVVPKREERRGRTRIVPITTEPEK